MSDPIEQSMSQSHGEDTLPNLCASSFLVFGRVVGDG